MDQNREAVDVVKLCAEIRNPDLSDVLRHDAAVMLIEKCELRTLRDVLATVFDDATPSVGGFDACADACRTVTTVASLA